MTIQSKTFYELESLIHLDLNNNLLYDLSSASLFLKLDQLQELSLSCNKIEEIQKDSFEGLSSLISLDLSENNLKYLSNETFIYLKKIKYL